MDELDYYTQQLEEARREVRDADEVMREAQARRSRAERRIEALQQVVSGLRLLSTAREAPQRERLPVGDDGDTVRVNLTVYGHEGEPPRGKEAVRLILSETPRAWRTSELVAEVLRRQWIDPEAKHPDAAVRAATKRLLDEGSIERVGLGLYRFKTSDDASSEKSARADDEPEATSGKGDEMPPPQT